MSINQSCNIRDAHTTNSIPLVSSKINHTMERVASLGFYASNVLLLKGHTSLVESPSLQCNPS